MRLLSRIAAGAPFGGVSIAALVLTFSCARGDEVDLGEGGGASADAGDARAPDGSIVVPEDDAGMTPDAGEEKDAGACTRKVVINEIMTRGGTASVEFVELYNPNTCAVPLGDWKLRYRSSGNAGNTVLHTFQAGASIPAKSFIVIGTSGFTGKKDATMTGGMADDGQVGLLDDGDVQVDALGYGSGTAGIYTEGSPAPAPPANGSVGRKSDGLDTDNNASDCKAFTTHSAGAANPP